jgi:endonuclease/exonuclease/phosphatase family metal-dependent hydrolase
MMFIFVFFKSFIVFIFVELASSIFIINKMNNKPQRCTRLQSQILLLGEEFECPLPLRERLGLAANENVSSGRGLLRLKNQESSSHQVNVAYGRGLLRLEKIRYQKPKGVFLQIITTHLDVRPFSRQSKR